MPAHRFLGALESALLSRIDKEPTRASAPEMTRILSALAEREVCREEIQCSLARLASVGFLTREKRHPTEEEGLPRYYYALTEKGTHKLQEVRKLLG